MSSANMKQQIKIHIKTPEKCDVANVDVFFLCAGKRCCFLHGRRYFLSLSFLLLLLQLIVLFLDFVVVKPGRCPYISAGSIKINCSRFQAVCSSDSNCNGDEKCCNTSSCGMRCQKPVFINGAYVHIFVT